MLHLPYLEFYITNVCNLNCENCNRCNNFNFTGHASWSDDHDSIKQWSQLLSLDEIGVLGGEPLLHPHFDSWLQGIADLWPHTKIKIVTNGTQWHRWPGLYEILVRYQGRVWLDVNCHDIDRYDDIVTQTSALLDDPVSEMWLPPDFVQQWQSSYDRVRDITWPDCDDPRDFDALHQRIRDECQLQHRLDPVSMSKTLGRLNLTDRNGIHLEICLADQFHVSTVIYDADTGTVSLHRSDPERAIAVCDFKTCPHIINGKLYKCGPVGILPDFIQQFDVDIPHDQLRLIQQYQPAEPDWDHDDLRDFVWQIRSAVAIPQCSLCPDRYVTKKFQSSTKKIMLRRRSTT